MIEDDFLNYIHISSNIYDRYLFYVVVFNLLLIFIIYYLIMQGYLDEQKRWNYIYIYVLYMLIHIC